MLAVGVRVTLQLTRPRALVVLAAVVLLFCSSVLPPILILLVSRESAERPLRARLEGHSRPLGITLMLLFGSRFAARGLGKLLG